MTISTEIKDRIVLVPNGQELADFVHTNHASPAVIKHALYGLYFHNLSQRKTAKLFGKSPATINRWIRRWEAGAVGRKTPLSSHYRKFQHHHREWILLYYEKYPLSYLDECAADFKKRWNQAISTSQLSHIMHSQGLTWKVHEAHRHIASTFAFL